MFADPESMAVLSGAVPPSDGRRAVTPLHAAVPGRARLSVRALRDNPGLQRTLQARLPPHPRIRSATASTVTGNLLVLFDPGMDVSELVAIVRSVVEAGADVPLPADPPHVRADIVETWHAETAGQVLARFGASINAGLSARQVVEQRVRHGMNLLPPPAERSAFALLLEQVSSLPVLMLLGSTVISLATGGFLDAGLVLAVITANATIGFVTTRRAERLIRSLAESLLPPVQVVRGGRTALLPVGDIVPGDLLLLTAGTIVPADARVVESEELGADESALTGESAAATKACAPVPIAAPLAERTSMVHRGTTIVAGRGKAVVTAVGLNTQLGLIQSLAAGARPPPTPMERQLDQLGRTLATGSLLACAGVFGLGLLRGYRGLDMLKTAVALAVAAVPEGLPTVATVTLALGIRRMRAMNVFVRRLDAIETLGAVNVVCFDKTGTLTLNRMSVRRFVADGRETRLDEAGRPEGGGATIGPALQRLLQVAVLCNDAEPAGCDGGGSSGSPTECALLDAAAVIGIDLSGLRAACPLTERIDRAAGRRYMRTVHDTPSGRLVALKGNPAEVLALCNRHLSNGAACDLTPADRAAIQADNERLAVDGLRVLGFAGATMDATAVTPDHLVWLGLAGLADPVRPGMRELMQTLHKAGVDTVMITGDQSMTAYAIAKELDLSGGKPLQILDGPNIDALPPEALAGLAPGAHVFARVTPAHKLRIVQALQSGGKVVAMTGDGINDSPALRAANIGLAMGRAGTDAAREMADVVLADDNLATIAVAIREGRTIHHNIKKSVRFLLSTNLSEIALTAMTVGLGAGQPLSAAQLLWLNLVTDVAPGLALGMEPAEPGVLLEPPRDSQAPIFLASEAGRVTLEGALIGGSAFAAHLHGLARFGGPNGGGLGFLSLILAQLLHGWSSRSPSRPLAGASLPSNPYLGLAVGGLGALQATTAVVPFTRRVLGMAPLDLPSFAVAGLAGGLPFVVNEILNGVRPAEPSGGRQGGGT